MKKQTRVKSSLITCFMIAVFLALTGCEKSGSEGAAGPNGVEIYSIVASPSVLRPGESTNLSVAAGDGVNSALTYLWQSDNGDFSSPTSGTTTWTAPESVGSYLVSVEVTNAAGMKSKGYASILVSGSLQGPIITSVNPLEVKEGDQIQITGVGFGITKKTSRITINGVPVTTISSWSDTVVLATVPTGATTGSVVITRSEIASNPGFVIVLWPKENPENTAISTAASSQGSPQLLSDGAGGAVIVWTDYRSGTSPDIYAQRVNSSGAVMWTDDGIAVCTATNYQSSPQLLSDGAGGAVIVWKDYRNGTGSDIYAQRVNSSGAVMWTDGGIAVCTVANTQDSPQLISDDAGGAVIVWADYRSGASLDIYAQRVNSSGAVMWTDGGIAVCTAANDQSSPQLVSDGAGGAVIVWTDYRSGTDSDIYAQRVNSSGAVMWTDGGIAVCTAPDTQLSPQLVSDGAGGAVIVWADYRSVVGNAIYAQRVNSSGAVMWTDGGIAVCTATNAQHSPQLVSDGVGGAVIVLANGGISSDIYAQRVNSSGVVMWTDGGISVCTAANDQSSPQLVSDGVDGAVIVWQDGRSGTGYYDIYAQGISSSGRM